MSSAKHVFRNTAATVALIAAALATTPAFAKQANIKSMSFNTESANTTIHVDFHRQAKMGHAEKRQRPVLGPHEAQHTWPGYVQDVAVALGVCGPGQCRARFRRSGATSPSAATTTIRKIFSFDPSQNSAVVRHRYRRRALRRPDYREVQPAPAARRADQVLLASRTDFHASFSAEHRQGARHGQRRQRGPSRRLALSARRLALYRAWDRSTSR